MDERRLKELLSRVRAGDLGLEEAVERLRRLPYDRLGDFATLDHHREIRSGAPEVVYGETKSAGEVAAILRRLAAGGSGALATRIDPVKAGEVRAEIPEARYEAGARALVVEPEEPRADRGRGEIAVVSAGTSDRPVAEEAVVTGRFLGHRIRHLADVGIAGLQRVVGVAEELRAAEAVVVVAGMEGALPSVVASLIDRPIVAVPTSVGYGVGLGGFVAMMSMLATCSPGVTVVNIDNGFGAAVAAARINRRREAAEDRGE